MAESTKKKSSVKKTEKSSDKSTPKKTTKPASLKTAKVNYPNLERLIEVIATLRGENGCDWDKEQTHKTLRPNMLEEAYEAVDAMESGNSDNLKEELGDVLWYVAITATAVGATLDDVMSANVLKLLKRYPNGFEIERSVNRDDA